MKQKLEVAVGQEPSDLKPSVLTRTLKRFAGQAAIYASSLIALRLVGFFLIPIYWRALTPADFGLLAAVAIISRPLSTLISLGFSESVTRQYYACPAEQRRDWLGTIWILDWTSSLLLTTLVLATAEPVVKLLVQQAPYKPFLQLGIIIALLESLALTPMMTIRILERTGLYAAYTGAAFLLETITAILLVLVYQRGALGMLEAKVFAGTVMLIPYILTMLASTRPKLNMRFLPEILRFSLPLVPGLVITSFTSNIDRFFLDKYIPLAQLGIYEVATTLSRPVWVINQGLKTAWLPMQVRLLEEKRDDALLSVTRVTLYVIFAVFLATTGIIAIIEDLVELIGVPEYQRAAELVPLAVLTFLILGVRTPLIQGYIIAKRTELSFPRHVLAFVLTVITSAVLIPPYGLPGAFIATAFVSLVDGVLAYYLSQKTYPIKFDWKRTLMISAAQVVGLGVALMVDLPSPLLNLLVRSSIIVITAMMVLLFVLDGSSLLKRRFFTHPAAY